ncbi:MAG TPA: alanine--tRNA ligase-related protein [Ktedonobacteraceae bacterium]|nr:alanine--tRNA ligase-related protein [Ktedonobacteraceae bacterium]
MKSEVRSIEIVERYLSFFQAHNHLLLPGSPLVVPGSTTSFIIAGMQPLLPYLRGEKTPPSSRLTSLQRCLRTIDIEEVGTNIRTLTSFFMLGNWSVGDYGKREAIEMAVQLLNVLGLDRERLLVTTFAGDPSLDLPPDEETIRQWQLHGFPPDRIVPLGVNDNLWTMGGPGPCGPCTEIFVDRGESLGCGKPDCRPGCSCARFLEVWNLVFIEFERHPDGSLSRLPFLSVDTGMGLERIASVLQDVPSVFETDLFQLASQRLSELMPTSDMREGVKEILARRIILDHTRSVLFTILEGVMPGRDGRNSVVRRLIRRASRQGRVLGIDRPFLGELLMPLMEAHRGLLTSEECSRVPDLIPVLTNEEKQFSRVLTLGLRFLDKLQPHEQGRISGAEIFKLHAEKGFPSDLAAEILMERGLSIDWGSYEQALEQHREVSRVSVRSHFRG